MTRNLITLAFTVLLAAGPAFAQEQVTVVRKSGERVSGRFEAWNRERNAVYVRVSLGDQRIIPFDDVARIEVGGGAAGTSGNEGGPHVLVTSSGDRMSGRLTNIEGGEGSGQDDQPRIVTFQSARGERRIPMSQVALLNLAPGNATTGTSGSEAALPQVDAPAGAVRVAANTRWTPTNLRVRRGQTVQFDGRGQIQLSTNPEDVAATAGSVSNRKPGYGAPSPDLPAGALIGRVGENGQPFAIGNQTTPLPMNGDGLLYLGVNDDDVNDNRGEFVVMVRPVGRR